MLRYIDILKENGFQSDQEFMEAWAKDPVQWVEIFNIRMAILSVLSE